MYTCPHCDTQFQNYSAYAQHFTIINENEFLFVGVCPNPLKRPTEILIQSHDWGRDVTLRQYLLPFLPARIVAVYDNMVTGYCGGGDDPAVGQVITGEEDEIRNDEFYSTRESKAARVLSRLVGSPGGYQHCRIQVVVEPA